ncbi:hypothetical protein PWT90_10329 [Aphanocladium album]|nr:hypothetical protein PWT90_10329 [Aphanocladium album]
MNATNLEVLPPELVAAILYQVTTVEALGALVRASPVAYDCFQAQKDDILKTVLFNKLGPVIRDAIFGFYQCSLDFSVSDNGATQERASLQYEHLLQTASPRELRVRASPSVVLDVINHVKAFSKIIDWITTPVLEEIKAVDAAAAGPVTHTERRRFMQGLFRYAALSRYHRDYRRSDFSVFIFYENPCLRMFRAWELQQISDTGCYLGNMVASLKAWQANDATQERDDDEDDAIDCAFDPKTNHIPDLTIFCRRVENVMAADAGFSAVSQERRIKPHLEPISILQHDNLPWYSADAREYAEKLESEANCLTDAGNVANPPFAWVDATAGAPWPEWGNWPVNVVIHRRLLSWRWLGFMFWDRERVERLKQTEHFAHFLTGWFAEDP